MIVDLEGAGYGNFDLKQVSKMAPILSVKKIFNYVNIEQLC